MLVFQRPKGFNCPSYSSLANFVIALHESTPERAILTNFSQCIPHGWRCARTASSAGCRPMYACLGPFDLQRRAWRIMGNHVAHVSDGKEILQSIFVKFLLVKPWSGILHTIGFTGLQQCRNRRSSTPLMQGDRNGSRAAAARDFHQAVWAGTCTRQPQGAGI